MESVFVALIGGAVTLLLTIIGYLGAKKSGIGPTQEKLVGSLKDLVETQEGQIQRLEAETISQARRITSLETEIRNLKRLTIRQAKIITKLMTESSKSLTLEELEATLDGG